MIPGRRVLRILGFLAAVGCDGPRPADAGRASGQIELRRTEPDAATLVRTPAAASWCDADSSLVIVGVTGAGAAGIAARVVWPLAEPDSFAVGRRLDSAGAATVVWRPLADSARAAFIADTGLVVLRGDGTVSGSVAATGLMNDTVVVRVRGTLSEVPVLLRCPGITR